MSLWICLPVAALGSGLLWLFVVAVLRSSRRTIEGRVTL